MRVDKALVFLPFDYNCKGATSLNKSLSLHFLFKNSVHQVLSDENNRNSLKNPCTVQAEATVAQVLRAHGVPSFFLISLLTPLSRSYSILAALTRLFRNNLHMPLTFL